MKQMRGLIIAAVVLAVLSGLVFWSKKHKAEEAAKPSPDAAPKILTLDEKKVDEVSIRKSGADPVVLSKLADKWEITKPTPMPADQDTVASIVSTGASLTSDHLVDEHPGNLAPFGLDAPATEVTISQKGGKPATIQLGKDTLAGGSTYVKLAGDPRVFTVASFSKSSLDKSLNDLRDKRLLTFNQDKISRVELAAKNGTEEFGKNGQGEWQILKPQPYRADAIQVDELVRKLKDAKVQMEAGKVAASTFAAAPKIATVSVTDNSGTQTAEIHQDKDKNTYAKSSVTDGIYKIGADVADAANKSLVDFRSKKLFDFGFTELSSLTAQGVTYTHSGDKWFAAGKEVDASTVQNLADKLRDLSATGFAEKNGGNPIFTGSIVTQDKKRTEKVSVTREGSNTWATREGEPAVYALDASVADDLVKAAAGVKPANAKTTPAKK